MHNITPITHHNLPQIVTLAVELWPDTEAAAMQQHYQNLLNNNQGTCLLAQEGSTAIGFIEIGIRHDYVEGADDTPVAYVEGLYVREAYRHKGWGSKLITHAEQWAKAQGFKQLCSDTELDNTDSIHFHTKAGFTETNRIICFVKNL